MEWIKIKNRNDIKSEVPLNKPFLCLWKGAICLCEFDEDIQCFYIGMMPASYLGFWRLDPEREAKITHWVDLELPKDY